MKAKLVKEFIILNEAKGNIPVNANKEEYTLANNKLSSSAEKRLRSNPKEFIITSSEKDLLAAFPISQKQLNKEYKGNIKNYRNSLIEKIRSGSLVIENYINEDFSHLIPGDSNFALVLVNKMHGAPIDELLEVKFFKEKKEAEDSQEIERKPEL
jgi:hypothetical protein